MQNGEQTLKAQIEERIAFHEAQLRAWRNRLAVHEETELALRSPASTVVSVAPAREKQVEVQAHRSSQFAPSGLTDLVKRVVLGAPGEMNPVEVRQAVERLGFIGTKNLHVSVGTTLKRLAERGVLEENQKSGRRYYRAKVTAMK